MFHRTISVMISSICIFNVSLNAQQIKRFTQKISEPPKEITKDSKTGAMIGIENGFNLVKTDSSDMFVIDFGVKLGYNLFFTKEWGLRLYGSYNYNFTDFVIAYKSNARNENLYIGSHFFLFNSDILYDFYNNTELKLSLGIILGLSAGYELSGSNNNVTINNELHNYTRSGFRASINAGFSMLFSNKHRLEIMYKYVALQPDLYDIVRQTNNIPPNQNQIIREEYHSSQSPFSFYLGYTFVF